MCLRVVIVNQRSRPKKKNTSTAKAREEEGELSGVSDLKTCGGFVVVRTIIDFNFELKIKRDEENQAASR